MTRAFVDELIRNMKKAGIVEKVLPWMVEGFEDKQMNVRYVGIKIKEDWLEVFSPGDNLLLKFVVGRNYGNLEYFLANNAPFVKITRSALSENGKWETMLGEFKRRLKKDKTEFINHKSKAGNLFEFIKPFLRE